MSITLSLYDVFANTIPGLLYLFAINEFLKSIGKKSIDITNVSSLSTVLIFLGSAYILGHLFNTFTFNQWYRLFNRKHDDYKALEKIKLLYPDLKFKFKSTDAELLFTALQINNKDLADRIETSRVNAIMMRNVSFGLFLVGIVELINFILYQYEITYLILVLASFLFSMIAIRQTSRFYQWFFRDVFKSAIVFGNSLETVISNLRELIVIEKQKHRSIRRQSK